MASGGNAVLIFGCGLGLGAAAGFIAAKPQESLDYAQQLWQRLQERLGAAIRGATTGSEPHEAPAVVKSRYGDGVSSHRASKADPTDVLGASARVSSASAGDDCLVEGDGLSPTASLAGSIAGYSLPPTPLASGAASRTTSSGSADKPGEKLRMVRGVGGFRAITGQQPTTSTHHTSKPPLNSSNVLYLAGSHRPG